MKTFKAKHNKGYYKSTDAWIDAVYRNNKTVIDLKLSKAGKPKAVFKQIINEYMEEGLTPTKAMSTLAKSTIFTPEVERLHNNMMSGLKGDRAAYKTFRELTKEHGRYAKFDPEKIKWHKDEGVYVYDGSVVISFQNSPFGVNVRRV